MMVIFVMGMAVVAGVKYSLAGSAQIIENVSKIQKDSAETVKSHE